MGMLSIFIDDVNYIDLGALPLELTSFIATAIETGVLLNWTIDTEVNNYGFEVQLTVYNVIGQEVITFVNQHQKAGNYQVNYDASNLSSGTYIYKITAGNLYRLKNYCK